MPQVLESLSSESEVQDGEALEIGERDEPLEIDGESVEELEIDESVDNRDLDDVALIVNAARRGQSLRIGTKEQYERITSLIEKNAGYIQDRIRAIYKQVQETAVNEEVRVYMEQHPFVQDEEMGQFVEHLALASSDIRRFVENKAKGLEGKLRGGDNVEKYLEISQRLLLELRGETDVKDEETPDPRIQVYERLIANLQKQQNEKKASEDILQFIQVLEEKENNPDAKSELKMGKNLVLYTRVARNLLAEETAKGKPDMPPSPRIVLYEKLIVRLEKLQVEQKVPTAELPQPLKSSRPGGGVSEKAKSAEASPVGFFGRVRKFLQI